MVFRYDKVAQNRSEYEESQIKYKGYRLIREGWLWNWSNWSDGLRQGTWKLSRSFITAYAQNVYYLAYTALDDVSHAEDILQDVFVDVFRFLPSLKAERAFEQWLYRLCMNHCSQTLKQSGESLFFDEERGRVFRKQPGLYPRRGPDGSSGEKISDAEYPLAGPGSEDIPAAPVCVRT